MPTSVDCGLLINIGYLFHCFGLGSRADTRYGQADVDGWSDTLVKQLGLQEDLAVSDRNHVSRNISRHITSLREIFRKLLSGFGDRF
jgi:hypothetical protein